MNNKKRVYKDIAKLHKVALNKSFLSNFSQEVLEIFYESIDRSKKNKLVYLYDDESLVGYVSIGVSLKEAYSLMFRKPLKLIKSLIPQIFNPKFIFGILESFFHNNSQALANDIPEAELFHIAVEENYRGTGASEKIFVKACKHVKDLSVESFKINVGSELDKAHSFYSKMGCYKIGKTRIHGNIESIIYKFDIPKDI